MKGWAGAYVAGPEAAALPKGRWVPRRGIQVYVLDDPADDVRAPMFCGTERGYRWHQHNDRFNWPLPADDPCGCRAGHRSHAAFEREMKRRRARQETAA